jgi:hypothetical protein
MTVALPATLNRVEDRLSPGNDDDVKRAAERLARLRITQDDLYEQARERNRDAHFVVRPIEGYVCASDYLALYRARLSAHRTAVARPAPDTVPQPPQS